MDKNKVTDILSKFIIIDNCWIWTEYTTTRGYGNLRLNKRMRRAHTVSYELFIGNIPDGLVIDHLCRNRACINPDHLEAVTIRENILRGIGIAAKNAKKTHCLRGHPLSGNNLYIHPGRGTRACKTCRSNISNEHYLANRVLIGSK